MQRDMNHVDSKSSAPDEGEKSIAPRKRSSVARSAGIVSLAVMASRVLGLVREMVFAYLFGASKSFANDAYVIAFRIPNLLRDLFAEGALSSAFVPVFSDYLINRDEKEAFRLSNLVATGLIVVLGTFVVLGVVFAAPLVAFIAPGFQADPAKFELTVRLTRIMMLAAQAMGVLNARDRFGIPALSSSFFNVGSIIGGVSVAALLTDPTLSHPIRAIVDRPTEGIVGMAYGVLIGGFLQYAVQWPSLRRAGFRYVFLGIENILDDDLAFLKASAKNSTRVGGRRTGNASTIAVDILHRHGMLVIGGLIVGNPDDTREAIAANLAFARKYVDWPYIQHPTPYPGTPMTRDFIERGLIVNQRVEEYDGTTAVTRSAHLSAEDIEFLRWKAERWMKVRHLPTVVRHDPRFVLRHGHQMLAHTFRGTTWRSLVGLESARDVFKHYRAIRERERDYVDWPDPLSGRPAASHAAMPPASSLTFVKPSR